MPVLPTSVSIDSNGNIFFVGSSSTSPLNKLFKFDTTTNSVEEVTDSVLQDFGLFFSIFVDGSGNLWVENKGWKGQDGVWNKILSSPVFIGESTNGAESSIYVPLTFYDSNIIFESSDKRLWFRAINGTSSLNLETKEWCKFTTYGLYNDISIMEDSEHNLWMIADGKLYKLPLGEK